jgi:hypothetical protein
LEVYPDYDLFAAVDHAVETDFAGGEEADYQEEKSLDEHHY